MFKIVLEKAKEPETLVDSGWVIEKSKEYPNNSLHT